MTPERATFTPNDTDTAVLISPPGQRSSPRWAFITRGSAREAIERGRLHREQLQRARHRRDIGILVGLVAVGGVLFLLRELGVVVHVTAWVAAFVGGLFMLSRIVTDPRPSHPASEDDVQQEIARSLTERDALSVCSVELARQLTAAQHHALTTADTFGLTREVLELLQEQLEARRREEEKRVKRHRREQALAIVDEHSAPHEQYPQIS
jgi:hypothetical protein